MSGETASHIYIPERGPNPNATAFAPGADWMAQERQKPAFDPAADLNKAPAGDPDPNRCKMKTGTPAIASHTSSLPGSLEPVVSAAEASSKDWY